jgi:Domain of unknown function (DUF4190)/Septum formation
VGLRFNPPPNWPPPPPGFVPPPRWQPDPAWPAPPPGWQLWVPDDTVAAPEDYPGSGAGPRDVAARRGDFATDSRGFAGASRDFPGASRDFPGGSRDFASGPTAFAAGTGAFAAGTGEFAAGRGEFAGGPGEFAAPGDFGRPGDFGSPSDFGSPGDFGPGAATELDAMGPPGAYPGQPGGPVPGPGPGRGGTNGFAIAAFVISLLGGTLLSLILGFIALGQIRRSPQRGRGLAIASIVLSVIWGAVLAFFLVGHSSGTPNTPSANGGGTPSAPAPSPSVSPSGGSTSGSGGASRGTTSVFVLRTGQCFQNPPASQAILGITTVAVVPCSTPHNAQVFVEFSATAGSTYPGRSALKRQADTGCHARISGNVKSSKITNSMTLRFLYPLSVSWAEGHRTITCLIVDAKPDLKSSLLRAHPKH